MRPDGYTLTPWSRGKSLVWDFTCRHTVCKTHVKKAAKELGKAAEEAYVEKMQKYEALSRRYHVLPVATETHGAIAARSLRFLRELGSRLASESGDNRSTAFLLQQLSVAVQRGNAACVMESVLEGTAYADCWNSDFHPV